MSTEFDLVVIGGGSGVVLAARVAASHGAKVALLEEYRYGGTCVIRGCVPKKLFVYASRFVDTFEIAPSFGWTVDASFDWPTLLANKDKEIDRLEGIYQRLLEGSNVTIFRTRGTITGPNSVALASGKTLTTKKILIATGAQPFVPSIEGASLAITSNEAFHLPQLPKSILIEGGGYIAVEFATIYAGLGVKTTLIYRGDQVLRGFDADVRSDVETGMRARGINFIYDASITSISENQTGYDVTLSNAQRLHFGKVMFATGRTANTHGLGLETAGVITNDTGAIVVDEYSKTNVDSIYAVGDVTGRAALTPVAIREGSAFAETVYNNNPTTVPYNIIPTAVFSEPEIGTVGMAEHEAAARHPNLDVYIARFRPMSNVLTDKPEKMLFKLICESGTQKVLGVHIVGASSGEMIQMVGIAMGMGATKMDLDRTIAVHPTAAEELVTLKNPSYKYVNGVRI